MLHVADRICVAYSADTNLAAAIDAHADVIARETLAMDFTASATPDGDMVERFDIDGAAITLAVTRQSR